MAVVFFSYTHKDEALRDELEVHLAMLKRKGLIEAWHDRRITAGQEIDSQISQYLEAADIILLLVSSDFLASEYCYGTEVARAMERQNQGLATVIPVILRPCDWQDAPFGKLLATPMDGKPVTQWPDHDIAFLEVTKALKAVLHQQGKNPVSVITSSIPAVRSSEAMQRQPALQSRSSNLRVAKNFTDHDKDVFLRETFGFFSKFFENSLAELSQRNIEIETRFLQLDANRFTASAYRSGQAITRCTVFLSNSGFGSLNIGYSTVDDGSTNLYSQSLSIQSDEQKLYLQPLMSMAVIPESDGKLTPQGGAELLWETFIAPLQQVLR